MQDELHGVLPALHPPHPHHHHHQATFHLTIVEKVAKKLSQKTRTLLLRFSIKKSNLRTSVVILNAFMPFLDILMFQLSYHFINV
jgi:hypothetical protein